jgi:hypothetical protein
VGDFDIDEVFGVIRAEGRSLEVSTETVLQTHYGSKEIHLIFNMWYDFNYQPAYANNCPQVDHIFPQSKLKQVKVANPSTGRMDILKYKWWERDQLANCMLLTAMENGAGGKCDTLPDVWFADKDEKYLDRHLVPRNRELWKLANFERFVEARKALIVEKLGHILITAKQA